MHIVLIEPHFAGHRPTYLYLYSKILMEAGHQVSVISGAEKECAAFLNIEMGLSEVRVYPFVDVPSKKGFLSGRTFYPMLLFWKRLQRSIEGIDGVDFAFFMYLDYFLFDADQMQFPRFLRRLKPDIFFNKFFLTAFLDKCLPVKWSGILFRPFRYNHSGYKYFFRAKHHSSLAVLDETYPLNFEVKKRIDFPDVTDEHIPAELSDLARLIFIKAKGRKIISLLGSLEKRKGIMPLLSLVNEMDPSTYFFLIGGKLDSSFTDKEKKQVEEAARKEHCHLVVDGIPTEYDFNSLVMISDIIYLVYIDFVHSSNLLTKASLFGKPVLCLNGYCIAKRVGEYRTGVIIDSSEIPVIRKALENFEDLFDRSASRYAEYFAQHSQERLRVCLTNVLTH
jgi:hypothetical protein